MNSRKKIADGVDRLGNSYELYEHPEYTIVHYPETIKQLEEAGFDPESHGYGFNGTLAESLPAIAMANKKRLTALLLIGGRDKSTLVEADYNMIGAKLPESIVFRWGE